jgi:small subunit ribosomal protein S14
MVSKFQNLYDLKKKKKCNFHDRKILFMRDYHLPFFINYTYNEKKIKSYNSKYLYRCVLTGRHKGVYTKYKITRMAFKSLASSGMIPGVYKSSW